MTYSVSEIQWVFAKFGNNPIHIVNIKISIRMNRFVRPFPEKRKQGMCSQLNASYLQYRARNDFFNLKYCFQFSENIRESPTKFHQNWAKTIRNGKACWTKWICSIIDAIPTWQDWDLVRFESDKIKDLVRLELDNWDKNPSNSEWDQTQ